MTTTDRNYLSVHIYHNTNDLRAVLLGCVDPAIERLKSAGALSRYFFIRYWEGGAHVRLRLLPAAGVGSRELREVLEPFIERFLDEQPSLFDPDPAVMAPLMRTLFEYEYGSDEFIRIFGPEGQIPLAENNSYSYVPYRPEYDRYGGPHGIELSEEHFHVSSTIALEAIRESNSHIRTSTLGLALQLMLHFAAVFYGDKEQVAEFFRQYAQRWQALSVPTQIVEGFDRLYELQAGRIRAHFAQVQQIHERLEATESGALGKWLRHAFWLREHILLLFEEGSLALRPAAISSEEAIRRLLNSYVHMMNNRLGVLILEEVYLAHLIVRALDVNV